MKVIEIDTNDRRQVQKFLDLPFRLYAQTPIWVPPLTGEARRMLDRRRHPFYRHSEAAFFLAVDANQQATGRLAVLDNRNYNTFQREATAFFYLFECEPDEAVARALFAAGFSWAHQRGLNRVIGPRGFSILEGSGLLVSGFEYRPAFGIPYHLPYYAALIEAEGFVGREDLVSGYLDATQPLPEKIHSIARVLQQRRGLRVARFRTRRDLKSLVPVLRDLYNSSLEGTSGTAPLTEEEARIMADQMIWFADPSLIKIVMKGEQPVGFLFAYPDISAAVQRAGGRIFPFGWADMLIELRRTQWINVNGAGMVPAYRGLGGTALLFSEMAKSVAESRYRFADLVQIGVNNSRMQRELRDLGIDFYKTHRMYARAI